MHKKGEIGHGSCRTSFVSFAYLYVHFTSSFAIGFEANTCCHFKYWGQIRTMFWWNWSETSLHKQIYLFFFRILEETKKNLLSFCLLKWWATSSLVLNRKTKRMMGWWMAGCAWLRRPLTYFNYFFLFISNKLFYSHEECYNGNNVIWKISYLCKQKSNTQ